MTFAETRFKRIDQTLSHIFARNQTIDQDVNVIEIVALIIIRRAKIDLLSFMKKSSESSLHQTHDVRNSLTW